MPYARLLLLVGLALPGAAVAEDAPLGRLFFTPERRLQLDVLRNTDAPIAAPTRSDHKLTIRGQVRRGTQPPTLFVNDGALDADAAGQLAIEPLRGTTARVLVTPDDATPIPIDVGTTQIDRRTGDTRSALGQGHVRIHRSPR